MIILPLFWHDTMFIQVIFLFTEILNDVQKKDMLLCLSYQKQCCHLFHELCVFLFDLI